MSQDNPGAFWNQPNIEPKRKFRWLLEFANTPQFIVKSVTKPSFQIQNTQHQFLQHTFKFPGRVTWQAVNMTIVDPVNPDATAALYKILQNSGYVIPSAVSPGEGYATISKVKMVSSLGNRMLIHQISAEDSNQRIETWVLNNPQITSVNFDGLDYASDEALNIQIGVEYDWAELNPTEENTRGYQGWTVPVPQTGQGAGDIT